MPLTPEAVREKKFTTVRLREGYDITEVDHFLDEVEAELTRLLHDNELLSGLGGENADAPARVAIEPAPVALSTAVTPVDASSRAARLLEIAATNADQLIAEARDDADKLVSDARAVAERHESDARTRSEKLDAETSERRLQLFGELEEEREALSRTIDDLRSQERDFRDRLRSFFEAQLQILAGNTGAQVTAVMLSEPDAPARLRELLSEDGA